MVSIYLPQPKIEQFDAMAVEIGGEMNRSKVIRALVDAALATPAAMKRFERLSKDLASG